ncbi:tetratricopeptide repeat protein [Aureitalea sp. L0-47]|uniref:tetratricopeptide repeat protein n=1 Tax=Aureitalea sp. L0-47 TaxID=2816962 RepID=UPI0022383489|nr:tetratricopeptide repeat protein [Aureitalea sp. L0-47]MCW5519446.1 tetratricopeptide repeat protein [Aureitalea sp. L0-47]
MKKLLLVLVAFLALQLNAQSKFTAKQWQDDLRFLQNTVHKDYPFLFKKVSAEDFDAAVEKLHNEIPDLEEHEISVGFARIIGMFKYGHTRMGWTGNPVRFRQLPINMYHFSDGVYVQGVHKDYSEAIGARVISIGGMPIMDALKKVYPVVPVENEQFFRAYGFLYLNSPEVLHAQGVVKEYSETIPITFEKDGNSFTRTLTALPAGKMAPTTYGFVETQEDWLDARESGDTPLYLKNLDKIYYYEYIPEEKTVYVRQSQIQDDPSETIPEFYDRVFDFIENNDVEHLVLDVRLNGGGNNYKNKDVVTRIIQSEKVNKVGGLMVILGRRTFSACQNLVNELDNYTNATFIGEPTGENINFYGDNNEHLLPNTKLPVYLSYAWWQDKPQWENDDWLAPHLAVEMSFEDYKTNKDPVLEAALSFDGEDFVLDPMEYMTMLYTSGQQEKLATEVPKMVQDPRYKFFDFEGELNNAGYRQLTRGDHQTGIAIFSFITQIFPDSANAWDSLAEGYMEAGDLEKAKELYNKALSMDPDGPTGKNASMMLKKIERGH